MEDLQAGARVRRKSHKDEGQVSIFVVTAVGTFLLGFVGFGVDMTNLFLHKQMAQGAADAACVAAGMDMYVNQISGTSLGGFTRGTAYNCTSSSTDAPCKYAALNGYTSPGLAAGAESNLVSLSFPASVPGAAVDTTVTGDHPFVQVDVVDRVKVYFSSMLSGSSTQDVRALAKCGLQDSTEPVSIIVLDPRNETSVTNNGSFTIDIYGGPARSIQVNSVSTSAVVFDGSSGQINLSQGGPNDTGSDFGISGAQPMGGKLTTDLQPYLGSTGKYVSPDSPISDPFSLVCAPGQTADCLTTMDSTSAPAAPTSPTWPKTGDGAIVIGPLDGCPLGSTCSHYQAGVYNSGIDVKNTPAVFEPGLYYIKGGMALDSNSQVCPGTGAGDGSSGTTFYFADSNSISVASNSGAGLLACSNSSKTPLTANDIKCTGGSTLPGNMPGSTVLYGNILLAPCSGYYGDPLGTSNPIGEQRGILFFQNRSVSASPQWGGGGAFTLAGAMYFHDCDSSSVTGEGVNCNATNGYTDQLSLQGGSCSGTYVLGTIIMDKLALGGNPCINMDLNPVAAYKVLKVALLQ